MALIKGRGIVVGEFKASPDVFRGKAEFLEGEPRHREAGAAVPLERRPRAVQPAKHDTEGNVPVRGLPQEMVLGVEAIAEVYRGPYEGVGTITHHAGADVKTCCYPVVKVPQVAAEQEIAGLWCAAH